MPSNFLQSDLTSFQSLECMDSPQFFNERSLSSRLNPDAVESTSVDLSLNGQNEERSTENSDKNLNESVIEDFQINVEELDLMFKKASDFLEEEKELFILHTDLCFFKEFCKEDFDKQREYINCILKPYAINKVSENSDKNLKYRGSEFSFTTIANSENQNDNSDSCGTVMDAKFNNKGINLEQTEGNGSHDGNKKFSYSPELLDLHNFHYQKISRTLEEHIDLTGLHALFDIVKIYCDKDFDKYHKCINSVLKPYAIYKVSETSATGTR